MAVDETDTQESVLSFREVVERAQKLLTQATLKQYPGLSVSEQELEQCAEALDNAVERFKDTCLGSGIRK